MPGSTTAPSNPGNTSSCEKTKKHWIGVKVVDEAGTAVTDVAVVGTLDAGGPINVDFSTAALGPDGAFKTDKTLDATKCDFTFPALFDAEWWPSGGSAPKLPGDQSYTAGDGDCVLTLAFNNGYRAYHTLWDCDDNKDFKINRPNPNMLLKDDAVKAPGKKTKKETKAVDQVWTFVVKAKKPAKLRFVVVGKDGKPLAGRDWEMKTPVAQKGRTGNDGLIDVANLVTADTAGSLTITVKDARTAPTPTPVTPPTVTDPPAYPPAITVADFKDKNPAPDFTAKVLELDLKIGSLGPVKTKPGVLARLHNFGFGCDLDSDDPTTVKVVKAYQRAFQNNPAGSGKTDDIQDDLGAKHDTI